MTPVILFFVLVALPAILMASAHYFGVFSQDLTINCTVLIDDKAPPSLVAEKHAARYGLTVSRLFDSAVKGYIAVVPVKQLQNLEHDPRVTRIDFQEDVLDSLR